MPGGLVGGFSKEKEATSKVQGYCDQVKSELEAKMGANFGTFRAISCMSQVVAGTNYIVKVDTGDGCCVCIKIFVPLPQKNEPPSLLGYQVCNTPEDPIVFF
ncbi:cystatin-B-like [Lissotriton helveticus]